VDFRALNSISMKDRFLLPIIDKLLDELGGAKLFSKLDFVKDSIKSKCMTLISITLHFAPIGTIMSFRSCPFVFPTPHLHFQATMNELLNPFLCKFVIVFFDDILVYHLGHSLESSREHVSDLASGLVFSQRFQMPLCLAVT